MKKVATAVKYLRFDLGCTGVTVASVPHTVGTGLEDPGRYGAVQMSLYGPLQTGFLNRVRTVSVAHDGNRWRFDDGFYGPGGVLVTSDAPTAPDGKVLALPQAQAWFGIRPGANECVPG